MYGYGKHTKYFSFLKRVVSKLFIDVRHVRRTISSYKWKTKIILHAVHTLFDILVPVHLLQIFSPFPTSPGPIVRCQAVR